MSPHKERGESILVTILTLRFIGIFYLVNVRRTNAIVRDGMIRAVGVDIAIPADAQVIDGKGKILWPASSTCTYTSATNAAQFLEDALDSGVTTKTGNVGCELSLANKLLLMATATHSSNARFRCAATNE